MSAWASGNFAAKLKQQRQEAAKAVPAAEKAPVEKSATPPAEEPAKEAKSAKATPQPTPQQAPAAPIPAAPAPAPSVSFGPVSVPAALAQCVSDEFTFTGRVAAPAAPAPLAVKAPQVSAPQQHTAPAPVAASSGPHEQPVPVDQYYPPQQPSWQRYQSNPSAEYFVPQSSHAQGGPHKARPYYGANQSNTYGYGPGFGEIPQQYHMRQQVQNQQWYQPSWQQGSGGYHREPYADPYAPQQQQPYGGRGYGYNAYHPSGGYGHRLQPMPPYYPPRNNSNQQMAPQGY